jgi:hypothetical protein
MGKLVEFKYPDPDFTRGLERKVRNIGTSSWYYLGVFLGDFQDKDFRQISLLSAIRERIPSVWPMNIKEWVEQIWPERKEIHLG